MTDSDSGLPLRCATLQWHNEQPRAPAFDDIYHSADGAGESLRVYIEPAAIPERWLKKPDFTVAELGFGTGFNLAALMARWQRAPGTRLHYIGFERYPLSMADWAEVCSRRHRQHPGYADLRSLYPPAISGWHQRNLAGGAIRLHLYWGDASAGLADLHDRLGLPVDAWWLDGFTPERNPELWSEPLFAQVAALSTRGTSVTTFSAAGRVRRGLQAVGFAMRRVNQLPHKHESLAGVMQESPAAPRLRNNPAHAQARQLARRQPIQVIGAGMAGATLAAELAGAGLHVQVFDSGTAPLGASSLPAAVVHSRLLADGSDLAALRIHSQLYSSARLRQWPQWQADGVLQTAGSVAEADKLRRIGERFCHTGPWCASVSAAETKQRTRHWMAHVQGPGLWFPDSGVISPVPLIRWLLAHPNIEQRWQQPVTELQPWPGIRIYANGTGIFDVASARFLELSALGGQLDRVADRAPASALVGAGYVVPLAASNGSKQLLVGGNYEYQPWSPAAASAHNLAKLGRGGRWLGRSRGVRVTSSDRVPVAGHLVDIAQQPLVNRLVSVGHGSLGMSSSHLCAALLTSLLTGSAPPVTAALESALAPLRFRERQARRGYRFGARP